MLGYYEIEFYGTMIALIVAFALTIFVTLLARKVKEPKSFFIIYVWNASATWLVIVLLVILLISTIFEASVNQTEAHLMLN